MLNQGVSYLKGLSTAMPQTLADARLQAYAIYVLTRNGVVTTNYLTNLQLFLNQNFPNSWQSDLTGSLIAATYQLLQQDKTATGLITAYPLTPVDNAVNTPAYLYPGDFFDQASSNALYVYLLAKHFPQQFNALGDKPLTTLAEDMANSAVDTTDAAYTILALQAYQANANMNRGLGVNEILAGGKTQALALTDNSYAPLTFDPSATQLQLTNQTSARYFYQVYVAGYDSQLPTQAIAQGIQIAREYRDANDKPIAASVSQGTVITVHLQLRANNNQSYAHIAVVDLLPGGFELVPNSIQGNYDYVDVREDRLIFFTTASPTVNELTYQIKPVVPGEFTVPPPFAENMYNPRVMALGVAGKITVV